MTERITDFTPYLAPSRGARAGRSAAAGTAFDAIHDGARLLIPPLAGTPIQLLAALDEARDRWSSLEIVGGLNLEPIAPVAHAGQPFRFLTWQFSAAYRAAQEAGQLAVIPARYSQIGRLFSPDGAYPVDAVLVQVSPPGPDGRFSLGVSVGSVIDAVRSAPLVIAQINPQMPYSFGAGELPRDAFDFLVEIEGPLQESRRAAAGDIERRIAEHVAALVPDGATLQFGIGAVPEAIIALLQDRADLGIHSGMISDGVIDLVESGALTNARKAFDDDAIVCAEVIGSHRVFDWLHRNPRVRLAPARYTHGLDVLSRCARLVTINSAVQVGLDGAVNAESVGGRLISGPGGQPDFAEATLWAEEAIGIVAMPSTAARGTVSRIVPQLDGGATVTTSRALADRVVTEYGVATLRGRTLADRAAALRAIAHPNFRQALDAAPGTTAGD